MSEKRTVEREMLIARPAKRLGAYIIDKIIPWIFGISLLGALASGLAFILPFGGMNSYGGYNSGLARAGISGLLLAFCIAYIVVECIFYSKGQTIGKAILGLRVVNQETGKPLTFWWMLFREWIVKPACGSILWLGYIWVLVDDRNRSWQDKILDTYVIDVRESLVSRAPKKAAFKETAGDGNAKSAGPAAPAVKQNASSDEKKPHYIRDNDPAEVQSRLKK